MRETITDVMLFLVGVLAAAMVAVLLPTTGWGPPATWALWTLIFYPIAAKWFPSERRYWLYALLTVGAATTLSVLGTRLTDGQRLTLFGVVAAAGVGIALWRTRLKV